MQGSDRPEGEDLPSKLLILHRRVAGADPEVGRGEHHQHRRVTEVVLQKAGPTIIRRIRRDDRDRSGGTANVPRPLPNPSQVAELVAVRHQHKVPRLPVLRRRREPARLEDRRQVLLAHRRRCELPHVAARPQRIPRLHANHLTADAEALSRNRLSSTPPPSKPEPLAIQAVQVSHGIQQPHSWTQTERSALGSGQEDVLVAPWCSTRRSVSASRQRSC